MKKLILAACVAALGVPVSAQQMAPTPQPPVPSPNAAYEGGAMPPAVQQQQQQQQQTTVNQLPPASTQPNIDYGFYGGPSAPRSLAPTQRSSRNPLGGLDGPYKIYGVPDELKIAEDQQNRIREAAVEFGRFRRQFTGSTQFWMDEHRTELAKSRYAMDEPMWRGLHPPEYFGDGGYLYNTAESVGGSVIWGPPQQVPVQNPNVTPIATSTPPEPAVEPASRRPTTPVAPRVMAGGKRIYNAATSVGAND
jgi:hypothetical protein